MGIPTAPRTPTLATVPANRCPASAICSCRLNLSLPLFLTLPTVPVPANGPRPWICAPPRPAAWSASERLPSWVTPMMSSVVFMKGDGR